MTIRLLDGDCMDLLPNLPRDYFDSCVTDPPYHLTSVVKRFGKEGAAPAKFGTDGVFTRSSAGFMGRTWDGGNIAQQPEMWREVYEVMKPGAYLLAFGGTRTFHRMAVAIEDAGFDIRDCLMWLYGTGFPKSHDVSKGIDKHFGAERTEVIGPKPGLHSRGQHKMQDGWHRPWMDDESAVANGMMQTAPATSEAAEWEGWGTALKPAFEPIIMARKPLIGTVAENVLQFRTGAINIDECRIPTTDSLGGGNEKAETIGQFTNEGWRRPWMDDPDASEAFAAKVRANVARAEVLGRWPANVIHDGSDEVLECFPQAPGQQGDLVGHDKDRPTKHAFGNMAPANDHLKRGDSGSAARFFYCAKATKADRAGSSHPTVKPLALMRYLVKLVTPPGGVVLDPFAGSGTTLQAAIDSGFEVIGIEREPEYIADIKRRLA
jgi:DNA modification methylase